MLRLAYIIGVDGLAAFPENYLTQLNRYVIFDINKNGFTHGSLNIEMSRIRSIGKEKTMHVIRKDKRGSTDIGTAAPVMGRLSFDVKPVAAYASSLKVQNVREMNCICPLCSAGCRCIAHVQGREVVRTEGAGYPAGNSECALHSKGAAMLPVIAAELNILNGK